MKMAAAAVDRPASAVAAAIFTADAKDAKNV